LFINELCVQQLSDPGLPAFRIDRNKKASHCINGRAAGGLSAGRRHAYMGGCPPTEITYDIPSLMLAAEMADVHAACMANLADAAGFCR
jgi:hypothetical protein